MLDRRFIATYILLVGIPLLALFGIVDRGRKLRAPISVAGDWTIAANFSSLAGEPCSEPLARMHDPILKISQSGSHLILTLDDPQRITLAGRINGELLTAQSRTDHSSTSHHLDCESPKMITLTASVDRHARPESLNGQVIFKTGGAGAIVPIRATRQIDGARGGS
jgi:hypothetical protein